MTGPNTPNEANIAAQQAGQLVSQLTSAAETSADTVLEALAEWPIEQDGRLAHALNEVLRATVRQLLGRDLEHARRIAQVALAVAQHAPRESAGLVHASALWAMGNVHYMANELPSAVQMYRESAELHHAAGRHDEADQLLGNLVGVLIDSGNTAEAERTSYELLDRLTAHSSATTALFNLRLNLGTLAQRRNEFDLSLDHLREAERIAVALGDAYKHGQSLVNQSIAAEKLDRLDVAEALLDTACGLFAAEGEIVDEATAWLNRAILDYRQGNWQRALERFARASALFEKANHDGELPTVWHYRARCYLALGLSRDALSAASAAEAAFAARQMPREVAFASVVQGAAYLRLGRIEPALLCLDRALRLFIAEEDAVEAALVRIERAHAYLARRETRPALDELGAAMQVLSAHEFPLRHAQLLIASARCRMEDGDTVGAAAAYAGAWQVGRRDGTRPPTHLAYPIHYGRGVIAEAAGRYDRAQREYEQAMTAAADLNGQFGLGELRSAWMEDKRPAFEAAMRLALQHDDLPLAFAASERARAADWTALSTSGARPDDALDSSASALRQRIAALKARWHALATADQQPGHHASPEALVEIERELTDAYRAWRIGDDAPYSTRPTASLEELTSTLSDQEAFLAYDLIGDELIAFTLSSHRAGVVRRLASAPALRHHTVGLIHALEEATLFKPERRNRLLGTVSRMAQSLGRGLFAATIGELPDSVRRIWLVPAASMAILPIDLLVRHSIDSGRARDLEVLLTPSASWWLGGNRRVAGFQVAGSQVVGPQRAGGVFQQPVVVGHSRNGRLPYAVAEARIVADTLVGSSLLTEDDASLTGVTRAMHSADLVHIAAHGTFRPDNPMYSALQLADGLLTAYDVAGLRLAQRPLVVLSACQTGMASLRGGEVLGLAGSFLQAGATALVVSQWRVDDSATRDLMQAFYQHMLAGESVGAALRQAQATVSEQQPHPYFWAGFNVWAVGRPTS